MLEYILIYIVILLLIPIFDVILKNMKNILTWRRTLSLLQTYYDLFKLFHKKNTSSQFTSVISLVAPLVILVVAFMFLFLIPVLNTVININIIVLFHILALSAFFLIIYALDNATYFGGLGASREAFTLAISEPIVALIILWFIIIWWWSFDIWSIHQTLLSNNLTNLQILSIFILGIMLFIVLLVENKRFPFDNPSTHLEVTMIHEAMLLETNATTLAIMEIWAKLFFFAFINLFLYFIWTNTYWLTNDIFLFGLYILKVLVMLFTIASVEVFITKMRLFKYQNIFGWLLIIWLVMFAFYFLN